MDLSSLVQDMKNVTLEQKRKICLQLTANNETTVPTKWNRDLTSKEGEWVLKPQYFHSAAGLYLFLKYPHLRFESSPVDSILEKGFEKEFLNLASAVLSADPDGLSFLAIDFNSSRGQIVFRDVTVNLV